MKKILASLFISTLLSACNVFQSIEDALIKEESCWIDGKTLQLHYEARDSITSIRIWLKEEQRAIDIIRDSAAVSLNNVSFAVLKEELLRQPVNITLNRPNTHWRDWLGFEIGPADWRKQRKIIAIHTYH